MENYKQLKTRFLRVFNNLPLGERKLPIYHDKEYGPISWYVLWTEIQNDTKVAKRCLEFLKKLEII